METANVGQFRGEQHVRVCRSCESGNHRKFNAELAIHFPGLKCLNKPIVLFFQCFGPAWITVSRNLQSRDRVTTVTGKRVRRRGCDQ